MALSRGVDPFDLALSPWGFWNWGSDWPTGAVGTLIGGGQGRGSRGEAAASDAPSLVNASVDWIEKPDAHEFKIDLPGLKKGQVKVEVEDGRTLVARGQRQREETKGDERWQGEWELSILRFARAVRLWEFWSLSYARGLGAAVSCSGTVGVVESTLRKRIGRCSGTVGVLDSGVYLTQEDWELARMLGSEQKRRTITILVEVDELQTITKTTKTKKN
ncbi:hypothetical protein CBR_g34367 [Chara braunii]|uniref:SHSP domain-containing protein n=1 Tax=Chara braunii TaxID=69332 RepID=A0A388LII2_CHABU|nr:hypothetical protein CBR_g34367 [Chara braunii]|eukprot:GBG82087.1 hypothetical protein CBR_g34367 [Chara braunii]